MLGGLVEEGIDHAVLLRLVRIGGCLGHTGTASHRFAGDAASLLEGGGQGVRLRLEKIGRLCGTADEPHHANAEHGGHSGEEENEYQCIRFAIIINNSGPLAVGCLVTSQEELCRLCAYCWPKTPGAQMLSRFTAGH